MNKVSLFIPGLIPHAGLEMVDILEHHPMPFFNALLKYMHEFKPTKFSSTHVLMRLLQYKGQHQFPYAACIARAYGLTSENTHWAVLSPVQMQASLSQGFITGVMDIDTAMPPSVIDAISQLCVDYGFEPHIINQRTWLVAYQEQRDVYMTPLHDVLNENFVPLMPRGPSQHHWHLFQNECQMLMQNPQTPDVQQAFEKEGLNGIWMWGEGEPHQCETLAYDVIISDEIWVKGFCLLNDIPFFSLSDLSTSDLSKYENTLIIDAQLPSKWALEPDVALQRITELDATLLEQSLAYLENEGAQIQLLIPPCGEVNLKKTWLNRIFKPKSNYKKIIKKYERAHNT